MGSGLKLLVGTACVAVIAAVGYFFWGEYDQYSQRVEREQEIEAAKVEREQQFEAAKNELFKYAEAEPGDFVKVKVYCRDTNVRRDHSENPFIKQILTNCRALGYL